MTKPRKKTKTDSGFDPAALDQLLGERRTMADMDELFRQMKKALMERALAGELTHHLGYAPGDPKPETQPNHRNGTTPKTVFTEDGAIPVAIPNCIGRTVRTPRLDRQRAVVAGVGSEVRDAPFGIPRRS